MKSILISMTLAVFFSVNGRTLWAGSAAANIQGTHPESSVSGTVHFEETPEGLKIQAEVANVPAGSHGFHIHEKGSCLDQGNAAGSHFNPDQVAHGNLLHHGLKEAHAGDLGNLTVESDGKGRLEVLIPGLTLDQGRYGVLGRSVILHEKPDDFGQPVGNAGARIGCGIIDVKN